MVFICFDVTSEDTFDSASQWLDDIKKQIKEGIQVCLLGCKCDLEERQVSQETAEQFIQDYPNVEYFEVSVPLGDGLEKILEVPLFPYPGRNSPLRLSPATGRSGSPRPLLRRRR